MDEPKVFDLEGNERDMEWAASRYGVEVVRTATDPNQAAYRLVALRAKEGPAALVTQVLDEDGRPIEGQDVALYWPDAPDPPEPPTEITSYDWYPQFVHGLTNLNGDVGPGMGAGGYFGVGEGGPYAVWVRSKTFPSDLVQGLGMIAGTNHEHLDQVFQRMIGGEEFERQFELISAEFIERAENRIHIRAVGERDFYDVRAHLRVEGGPDLGTVHPTTIRGFELTTDYIPAEGEAGRTFLVHLERPSGTHLSEEWRFPYDTGKTGWWEVEVAEELWTPPKPPPPEPPPDTWTMKVQRRGGLRLLIGKMPEANIAVAVSDSWGNVTALLSGSKPEHGPGGWELNIWNPGTYTISFLDQTFQVDVGNETVTVIFTKAPAVTMWQLVSIPLQRRGIENIFAELEEVGLADLFTMNKV